VLLQLLCTPGLGAHGFELYGRRNQHPGYYDKRNGVGQPHVKAVTVHLDKIGERVKLELHKLVACALLRVNNSCTHWVRDSRRRISTRVLTRSTKIIKK